MESGVLLDRLMMLLRRSAYQGLLNGVDSTDPLESWRWLPSVVARLADHGVPAGAWWMKLSALDEWRMLTDGQVDTEASNELVAVIVGPLAAAVEQINDQMEMSPQPAGEWSPVIATLGEDLLASLIGVSVSSVRRYASATRATPQGVR